MSIRVRLLLLSFLASALIVGLGGTLLVKMQSAEATTQTLYVDRLQPLGEQVDAIRDALKDARLNMQLASAHDPSGPYARLHTDHGMERHTDGIAKDIQTIETQWAAYMATYLVPEEEKLAKEIEPLLKNAVEKGLKPGLAALKAGNFDEGGRLSLNSIVKEYGQLDKLLPQLAAIQVEVGRKEYEAAKAAYETSLPIIIALLVLGLLALVLVARSTMRAVLLPMQELVSVSQAAGQGRFDGRVATVNADEVGEASRAFNALMVSLQTAVREVNAVMGAVAKGDFSHRVSSELPGELGVMKAGVNASADSVAFTMSELGKVMDGLSSGNFAVRMDPKVAESFRRRVDGAMGGLQQIVDDINRVMTALAQGRLDARVSVQAQGALAQLADSINTSVTAMEAILNDVSATLVSQAQGDLTARVTASAVGNFQQLKEAANASASQMEQAVSAAVSAAVSVTQASGEVAQGNMELSDRTQEQAASLEETAAAMEQTLQSVNTTRSAIAEAEKISVDQLTQRGTSQALMAQTTAAMQAITQSSEQIGSIVSLIDSIAFQTNLLALNAAVEAARAGEHGRGFAVVAGEVRALAGKSADAAKEIKTLIDTSVRQVGEGSELIARVSTALDTIGEGAERMQATIGNIAQASGEQVKAIEQVNTALASIDSATQQNAALVEQTSAAAEGMSQQAGELNSQLSRFRVSQGAVPAVARQSTAAAVRIASGAASSAVKKPAVLPAPQSSKAESDEWSEF